MESQPDYKVWAYRQAGWAFDEFESDILALYDRGVKAIEPLPHIGSSIATFIAERLEKT